MAESEKVAITLPGDVYKRVERMRKSTGESRSAVIHRALRCLFRDDERAARVRKYVDAYRRHPETDAEVNQAEASAAELFKQVPWE